MYVRRELQEAVEDDACLMMQRKRIYGTTGVLGWPTQTTGDSLWVPQQ